MGVVYKARDTRLKRSVAIKVLPADQVSDPERKRRFIQEARAFSGRKPGGRLLDLPNDWEEFLQKAKIEDFRWHDLRHTFASRLVMAGVDLYTVCKLLGHHDIKMTMRYAHLHPAT